MRWPFRRRAILAPLAVGVAFVAMAAEPASETTTKPVALGTSPAYRVLGHLPMMHQGRIKPIDTVAREEVKQIYTRETIKLPALDGKPGSTWSPVAAFLDWSVRPKFWDEQPIIAVEYLPLKRMIFANVVRTQLEAVAAKASTSEPTRKALNDLATLAEISAAQIRNAVRSSGLPEADGKGLLDLAAQIGEETKWLSPETLETAEVTVDGKTTPFLAWLDGIIQRDRSARNAMGGKPKHTTLEDKAIEVAEKLSHYRAIRDKEAMGEVPLLAMPRPYNAAMLTYTGDAIKKIQSVGEKGLGTLEFESVNMIGKYLDDVPNKDKALPGASPEFDAKYTEWLKEKSAWVPVNVLREAPVDELTRAGYPTAKVEAFRTAFKAVEDEELLHPGQADVQPSLALIESAHDLGATVNAAVYPSLADMDREVHFNEIAPFSQAPIAYFGALLMLTFSLVASRYGKSSQRETLFAAASKGLYLTGLAAFAAGIGLEAYGFWLRVKITGWAPVSNMYETVIWVALVTSVLGLIMEAIYRRTYAALAASGVALCGTYLAMSVSLLDPTIHQLPPVLRSNLWLGTHVLTIVSSYAAFALAMGLGMVATGTYLVATYKRSPSLPELATPLVLGIPVLGIGVAGSMLADRVNLGPIWASYGSYGALVVASAGGLLCGMSLFATVGELINRLIFREQVNHAAMFSHETHPLDDANSDARTRAMQMTAAQIKPMANFIYRSMQVGILLVALGTFLGGWWADVSWGRFWGWDPKEVWALITLLVYLMPLHGRFAGWVNTFWLVMSSVVCFLSVLMAWYGVNFVLGVGLHSYGFTAGGGQGVVAIVTLVALAFAAGTFWRRRVSSVVLA